MKPGSTMPGDNNDKSNADELYTSPTRFAGNRQPGECINLSAKSRATLEVVVNRQLMLFIVALQCNGT